MSKPGISQSGSLIYGPGGLRLSSLQQKLVGLTLEQFELLNRAKKYATEQSIKSLSNKGTTVAGPAAVLSQSQQQKNLQRHQALVLMCRVYVGSVSFEVREEMIKAVFSPFGTVKSVNMSWDPVTLKHKGFAFVEYELPEAAQLALEHLNSCQLGNRQIKVGRPSNMPQAQPVIEQIQEECKQNNRIYVANVHMGLNEQELADLFEPFGKVRSCKLAMTPNVDQAQHRGCGFVEFVTEDAATEALTMDNFDLGGTVLHVCRATTPAENVSIYGTLDTSNVGSLSQSSSGINAEEDIQAQLEQANKEQERDSQNDMRARSDHSAQNSANTNGYTSNVSNVIVLKNMVTADEELDDSLQLDVYEECRKHGVVTQVVIYVDKKVRQPEQEGVEGPVYMDEVRIFVKYQDGASSGRAREALNGRFFAGRKVSAEHYDREMFRRHIYSHTD